ncbi:hypothetical protein KIL84_004493, partial [Mauremys mutica]
LTTRSHVTSSPSPAASYPVSCPGPSCPGSWIGYRGKCYYFSEMEGNWTYSQSQCSALSASLAVIDSEQDLVRRKQMLIYIYIYIYIYIIATTTHRVWNSQE